MTYDTYQVHRYAHQYEPGLLCPWCADPPPEPAQVLTVIDGMADPDPFAVIQGIALGDT